MGNIWIPDRMPDRMNDGLDVLNQLAEYESAERGKMTRLKVVIRDAVYHAKEGQIMLLVILPDGSRRSLPMHYKLMKTFNGRPREDTPREEIDRQMEITAKMFRKARGRKINVCMSEMQAKTPS